MSAVYPSAEEMLVCFCCMGSFRAKDVYALQCHHLICAECGNVNLYKGIGTCTRCRTPQIIDQNFTNDIFSWRETDPTPNYQAIRQSLDFMFVPCKKKVCTMLACPFDHSDYAKGFVITRGKKRRIKACRRCKVRGLDNVTKCVRCHGPLASMQIIEDTRFPSQELPVFSYFGNKRR